MLSFNTKVLIVSSWSPPRIGGGPQLLYNIFSYFNGDSYEILTERKNTVEQKRGGEALPCKYFFYDKNGKYNLLYSIKKGLRTIREENMEILVGTSDCGKGLLLTYILSLFSGKPYVLYLMDIYRWNLFSSFWNTFAIVFEKMLFSRAKKIIILNPKVEEVYKAHYGNRFLFELVRNSSIPTETPQTQTSPTPPFTIVYTGSVYWAQIASLENLIQTIIKNPTLTLKFIICSPKPPKGLMQKYEKNKNIIFHTASPDESILIQRKADILFLPLSFGTRYPRLINTSFPGKTPEYLLSGRPILIHAPKDSFLSEYGRQEKFAYVVDENNINALAEGIKKILTDTSYRQFIVKNAQRLFYKNHDAKKNAEKIFRILDSV